MPNRLALALCALATATPAQQIHHHPAPGVDAIFCWNGEGADDQPCRAMELLRSGPLRPVADDLLARLRTAWAAALPHLRQLEGAEPVVAVLPELTERVLALHPCRFRVDVNLSRGTVTMVLTFAPEDVPRLQALLARCDELIGAHMPPVDLAPGVRGLTSGRDGSVVTMAAFGSSVLVHTGDPATLGTFGDEPTPLPPQLDLLLRGRTGGAMHVRDLAAMPQTGAAPRPPMLDSIHAFTLARTLENGDLRDTAAIELAPAALAKLRDAIAARGPTPRLAALPDELARASCTVDSMAVMTWLAEQGPATSFQMPEPSLLERLKVLSGSTTITIGAPAGGLVPRCGAALGLTDPAAMAALLATQAEQATLKAVQLADADCYTVREAPTAGITPAMSIRGQTLLLAESPATLRLLLRGAEAAEAAPAEDDAVMTPYGPALPGWRFQFDLGTSYTALRRTFGTLLDAQMQQAARQSTVPGAGKDPLHPAWPDPEELAPLLGKGESHLVLRGNDLLLTSRSALGGPNWAFTALLGAPYVSGMLANVLDEVPAMLAQRLAPAQPVVGTLRLPDGTTVPALNGVGAALELRWPVGRQWSPINGTVTDGDGVVWYTHADGCRSTTRMVQRPDLGRAEPVVVVAEPAR